MPEQTDPFKRVARAACQAFATAKPHSIAISPLRHFKCALPARHSVFAMGAKYLAQRIDVVQVVFMQRMMDRAPPWLRVEHDRGEHAAHDSPASRARSHRRTGQSRGGASVCAQVRHLVVDSGLTNRRKS